MQLLQTCPALYLWQDGRMFSAHPLVLQSRSTVRPSCQPLPGVLVGSLAQALPAKACLYCTNVAWHDHQELQHISESCYAKPFSSFKLIIWHCLMQYMQHTNAL